MRCGADALLHVVVVDDDMVDRQGCLRALRGLQPVGVVTLCSNVTAALDVGPADLLLLDLNMPGRSGYDLLEVMPPAFARACMILLGAPLSQVAQDRLTAHDRVTGFLSKPLKAQSVMPVLHRLLHGSASVPDQGLMAPVLCNTPVQSPVRGGS